MMKTILITCFLVLLSFAGELSLAAMKQEKRVAFVIVNESYNGLSQDKALLGRTQMNTFLKESGFETIYIKNASRKDTIRALRKFGNSLSKGTVALFYYSGYTTQIEGINYLLPVDTINDKKDISGMKIEVSAILNIMDRFSNRLNMVLIDNVDNAGLNKEFNNNGHGLSKIRVPVNTDLVTAGKPNSKTHASNLSSIITKTFSAKGISNKSGFEKIKKDHKKTYVSLTGKTFYFKVPDSLKPKPKVKSADELLWEKSLRLNTQKSFEAYLVLFPTGKYSTKAKSNIQTIILKQEEKKRQLKASVERKRLEKLAQEEAERKALLAQEAKRKEELKQKYLKSFIEPKMVRIEAGSFKMGSSTSGNTNETPEHFVKIEDVFYIGKYEVSNAEYNLFLKAMKRSKIQADDNKPVVNVSWKDAMAYAQWLTNKTGEHYTLPSESEWEYVSRANSKTRNPWKKIQKQEIINAIGEKEPNAWGVYDLQGNVYEWCLDSYRTDYAQKSKDEGLKVIRGGSFLSAARELTPSFRTYKKDVSKGKDIGFRLVKKLDISFDIEY